MYLPTTPETLGRAWSLVRSRAPSRPTPRGLYTLVNLRPQIMPADVYYNLSLVKRPFLLADISSHNCQLNSGIRQHQIVYNFTQRLVGNCKLRRIRKLMKDFFLTLKMFFFTIFLIVRNRHF